MTAKVGPIEAGEVKLLKFPFTSEMEPDATISNVAREIILLEGVDATPEARLIGSAVVSGQTVLQRVSAVGDLRGNRYLIRMLATDSANLVHSLAAELEVSTDV